MSTSVENSSKTPFENSPVSPILRERLVTLIRMILGSKEPRFSLLFYSIVLSLNVGGGGMMEETIQNGCRQGDVTKDISPHREELAGCQYNGSFFHTALIRFEKRSEQRFHPFFDIRFHQSRASLAWCGLTSSAELFQCDARLEVSAQDHEQM